MKKTDGSGFEAVSEESFDFDRGLENLSENEKKIIRFRYGKDGTKPAALEETADAFGVSSGRVKQIEAKFLRKRYGKGCARRKRLVDFLNEQSDTYSGDKMAKIGIIGAMNSEVTTYCENLGAVKTSIEGIYKAEAFGHEIYICESGIGKVNAAISAQRLIDVFDVRYLINSGVAGCLTKDLSTCDAVIAKELTYHDFTPLDILDRNPPYTSRFKADEKLIRIAEKACEELISDGEKFKYIVGNIVSGDCFVNDGAKAKQLREDFGAFCTEMEGAAIAHVATVNKIPFAVIRTASDFADENADISFDELEKIAAKRASFIVSKMLEAI